MTGPAANVVVFYAQVQARQAPDPGQGYRLVSGFNHLTFVLRPLLAYFIKILAHALACMCLITVHHVAEEPITWFHRYSMLSGPLSRER